MLGMYGESYENLLEILAVVIILSPISSVCGTLTRNLHLQGATITYVMYVWHVSTVNVR